MNSENLSEFLSWLCNAHGVRIVPRLVLKPGKGEETENGFRDGTYYHSPLFKALPPVITLYEEAPNLEHILAHEFGHSLCDIHCWDHDEAALDDLAEHLVERYHLFLLP